MYQLDSLPRPGLILPSFWALCRPASPTVCHRPADRSCPAPPPAPTEQQFTTAVTPTPVTRVNSLPSGGLARPGSRIRRGARRKESWGLGSEKAGGLRGSPAARVPLGAAEPGQPSPSPGEVVSVRLGTPRSPARAGAVGGWVSAMGLFLALHSLRKSGASALPAPARSLGARTPGPDSGAERGSGWGPRGVRGEARRRGRGGGSPERRGRGGRGPRQRSCV